MTILERMSCVRTAMRSAGDLEDKAECDWDEISWEDFGNWHDAPVFTSRSEREQALAGKGGNK